MGQVKFAMVFLATFWITFHIQAQKPESAKEVIKEARAEAAKTHRNVFVIFHASWCVWCHRMDTAMDDETIKPFFSGSYVITHLRVDETKDKKEFENPGASVLLADYHGNQQGIPFWFILDKNGKLLADSRWHAENGKVTGNNVGCPTQPDEVAYFINILKKTSDLSEPQLEMIKKRFLKIGQ